MRVAVVVPEFPLASEAFIVDQFLGLLDRGIDVHLVAERENREAWSHFPELDRREILARIHLWPKNFAQRLLHTGHLLLRALASQPVATVRCAHRELRIGLSGAPGRWARSPWR